MIRRMFFTDGWPVLSPEPFAGTEEEILSPETAAGKWEIIFLTDENNDMRYSRHLILDKTDPLLKHGIIYTGWDFENGKENQLLTGITENGTAYRVIRTWRVSIPVFIS